ncbi:hypothetical protein Tco_0742964 [Tanacetum coccineum]
MFIPVLGQSGLEPREILFKSVLNASYTLGAIKLTLFQAKRRPKGNATVGKSSVWQVNVCLFPVHIGSMSFPSNGSSLGTAKPIDESAFFPDTQIFSIMTVNLLLPSKMHIRGGGGEHPRSLAQSGDFELKVEAWLEFTILVIVCLSIAGQLRYGVAPPAENQCSNHIFQLSNIDENAGGGRVFVLTLETMALPS